MDTIRIDVGVNTNLAVDLTEFDFTGIRKVILTIKNVASVNSPEIIEREFAEAGMYQVNILPEESVRLRTGAQYDFCKVMQDGKIYKLTENGKIELRQGVGDCIE